MSRLTLELVAPRHAAEIIAFERANRAFFARFVPDRGDDYFDLPNMERFLAEVAAEQSRGECYLYLVRDAAGSLVGRVNLVDVAGGAASIGYRIGEAHGGQGYATEAVRLALAEAAQHGINLVRAMTTVGNVGSQIVLLRTGFQFTERRPQSLEVNGAWLDAVHFERRLS
jgi:ribosomal-protein-alanine N-acetyltransferase